MFGTLAAKEHLLEDRGLRRHWTRFFAVVTVALLAACSGAGNTSPPLTGSGPSTASALERVPPQLGTYRRACDGPPVRGFSQCYAIVRTDAGARLTAEMVVGPDCTRETDCLGPSELQQAYNIVSAAHTGGKNMTVAVIDAYGYPQARRDLAAYRKAFKLPVCASACFRIVNQEGRSKPLPVIGSGDWEPEQALDLDMVSAICPNCKLILVQANSSANVDLARAVDSAVKLGADVVSNSYGCPENYCPGQAANAHYDHPGVVITASSGDDGADAAQPCSFATVICVGGTSLKASTDARGYTETVWDGLSKHLCSGGRLPCATGSGCSSIVAKPAWQTDRGCKHRSESDISAVADPYTGVVISCTPCYGGPFLEGEGGTSASSPIVAAMYALAGNAKTQTPAALWKRRGDGFNDVTLGTNESSSAGTFICPKSYSYICKARPGYDGPTGWGTPDGLAGL